MSKRNRWYISIRNMYPTTRTNPTDIKTANPIGSAGNYYETDYMFRCSIQVLRAIVAWFFTGKFKIDSPALS